MSDKPASPNPRARILDVATELFASYGYEGVTVRQVTKAAGVNLAAINYHFGGKRGLFHEVIRQKIRPLNQLRMGQLELALGGTVGPAGLDRMLELLVGPILETQRAAGEAGTATLRLFARCMADPGLRALDRELAEEMQSCLARFAGAIRRHAPGLPPEEFLWRLSFVVGALQHGLANLHQMSGLTRGICRDGDLDGLLQHFVASAADVFRAPPRPRPSGANV